MFYFCNTIQSCELVWMKPFTSRSSQLGRCVYNRPVLSLDLYTHFWRTSLGKSFDSQSSVCVIEEKLTSSGRSGYYYSTLHQWNGKSKITSTGGSEKQKHYLHYIVIILFLTCFSSKWFGAVLLVSFSSKIQSMAHKLLRYIYIEYSLIPSISMCERTTAC